MAGQTDTSEVNKHARDLVAGWVADGTPVTEPVTVSTPEVKPQEAIFADAPIPTPEEMQAQLDAKDAEIQAAKAELEAQQAAATEVTPVVETPAEAGSAEEVTEWFVGRDAKGEEFKVPAGFEIPITVDGEVSWVAIGEAQKGSMRQADYTRKTTTASQAKKAGELAQREYALNLKKLEAQRELLATERDELLKAAGSPEEFEALVKRMEDPEYKRLYKEAMEGRQLKAEQSIAQQAAQMQAADDATVAVVEWIDDFSRDPRFSGVVDPERLKVHYGHALHAGTAQISKDSVEAFFVAEAEAINRITGGSKAHDDKLATMQKELDSLKANRQTEHVVQRENAPNVAPTGGKSRSPAEAPQPKVRHVLAEDRAAAIATWVKGPSK